VTSTVPYSGIWPAMLTPLTAELDIDIASFARHASSLLDAGCTGVTLHTRICLNKIRKPLSMGYGNT